MNHQNVKRGSYISAYYLIWMLLCFSIAKPVFAEEYLPKANIQVQNSSFYGTIVKSSFANYLMPTNALGLELAFGAREFQIGGTVGQLFDCHLLKITAEYLSQHNPFPYLTGNALVWNEQSAFAAGYSYIVTNPWLASINFTLYQASARDDHLSVINNVAPTISLLERKARGAKTYGSELGVTLLPTINSKLDFNLFYDESHYHQKTAGESDRHGFGIGFDVKHLFYSHLLVELNSEQRAIYRLYGAKLGWRFPGRCANVDLSLTADYRNGEIPVPHEKRFGVQLTYYWGKPILSEIYLMPRTIQEVMLAIATKPLVHMPQTLVKKEEVIYP